MVSLDCQVDWIWNPLTDMSLVVSVGHFQEWLTKGEDPQHGQHSPKDSIPDTEARAESQATTADVLLCCQQSSVSSAFQC